MAKHVVAILLLLLLLNLVGAALAEKCPPPHPDPGHPPKHKPPHPAPKHKPPAVKPPHPPVHPPKHYNKTCPPPTQCPPSPPVVPSPPVAPTPVPRPPGTPPVAPTPVPSPPSTPPVAPYPPPAPPVVVVPYPPPSSPSPAPTRRCPIDALKLGACVDLLGGLVHVIIGSREVKEKCCPVIEGVAGLEAALCLCTTIRAKLLNINIILPIALEALVGCGKSVPPGFRCPPGPQ